MHVSEIWRLPNVLHHTGLSRSTIYEMIRRNEFPGQIRLGKRAVGWLASDVTKWVNTRISKSADSDSSSSPLRVGSVPEIRDSTGTDSISAG